jgi:hypothetical protein
MPPALPARANLEHYRKQAKALVRAFRAGEREAVARAEAVLGDRAAERFLLSDAQHVIARELGHRSWPDLVVHAGADDDRLSAIRAALDAARSGWGELGDAVLDGRVEYRPGEAVGVRVRKRGRNYTIDDDGAAVAKAGRPRGWLDVARRVAENEYWLNVNRRGVIFVPAFEHRGMGWLAWVVLRVADASLAVYQELLELEG